MCAPSHQLTKISIKGYKSIKECDISLNSINVLIGSNGAGKSNFLSVFTLLHHILKNEMQSYTAKKVCRTFFYEGVKTTPYFGINFYFGDLSFTFELEMNEYEEMRFREGSRFSAQPLECIKANPIRVYHFQNTSPTAEVKSSHSIHNNEVLFDDARNLAAFLYHLRNNYFTEYNNIVQTIRLVAPYFSDFVLTPNGEHGDNIFLKWKQKRCEDIFGVSQFSDGTLRFICLVTLLLQPAALQPSTIVIDEPEIGLHPYAITIFSEMVKKAAVEKQVVISTQSVELLNHFNAEDVIVVDRGDEGSTFTRLHYAQLAEWLEDDYTLGDLWNKNILGGRYAQ